MTCLQQSDVKTNFWMRSGILIQCVPVVRTEFFTFLWCFLAFLLLEYLRRFCPKIKIQQTLVFCLHLYYYEILVTNPSEIRNLRYDMSFNDINQAMAKGLLLWRLSRHQFNSFSCSRSQLFKANFHFFIGCWHSV